ncbi:hypothetical protein QF027_000196 [Streptomyces canus]|nr:hypothetical protein [Streptomyces canus]
MLYSSTSLSKTRLAVWRCLRSVQVGTQDRVDQMLVGVQDRCAERHRLARSGPRRCQSLTDQPPVDPVAAGEFMDRQLLRTRIPADRREKPDLGSRPSIPPPAYRKHIDAPTARPPLGPLLTNTCLPIRPQAPQDSFRWGQRSHSQSAGRIKAGTELPAHPGRPGGGGAGATSTRGSRADLRVPDGLHGLRPRPVRRDPRSRPQIRQRRAAGGPRTAVGGLRGSQP